MTFEPPTKGDIDRALSNLMHENRHKLLEECNRIKSEAAKVGALQGNRVIVSAVEAADHLHKDAMTEATRILFAFIERTERPPIEIVGWARPHLENLGNSLLGVVPPNGFPDEHQRLSRQYRAHFSQRLDGVLRDVEIGYSKDAGFAKPVPSGPSAPVEPPAKVMAAKLRAQSASFGRANAIVSPSVNVPPSEPSASTAPAMVSVAGAPSVTSVGNVTPIIERALSERPVDIREAARALSEAIADQIEYLNSIRPNPPEALERHDDLISFLRRIADGLDTLGRSIDLAIKAGSPASPEPILLGKAAKVVGTLGEAFAEGFARNRTYISDCAIKFSVLATGFSFLHFCGVDGITAGFATSLMNVRLPEGGKAKKAKK
jgi:hypothetical protein